MSIALLFPGQGSQHIGMGKDLYDRGEESKNLFETANKILGFSITDIMFSGTMDELTRTSVTQPAIFLHSVILALALDARDQLFHKATMAAGHSLGEFSALVVSGVLGFEDALKLVSERSEAMQYACDLTPSTMAAVVGLDDYVVEDLCNEAAVISGQIVVPANYNAPGQLVISGTIDAIDKALELAKSSGAKLAKKLTVNGAFHSPLMKPAEDRLAKAIDEIKFNKPKFPIYQNCVATGVSDSDIIKSNLKTQLTAPVKWTQSMLKMIDEGGSHFMEIGPGKTLQGLMKRISSEIKTDAINQYSGQI